VVDIIHHYAPAIIRQIFIEIVRSISSTLDMVIASELAPGVTNPDLYAVNSLSVPASG